MKNHILKNILIWEKKIVKDLLTILYFAFLDEPLVNQYKDLDKQSNLHVDMTHNPSF